MSLTKDNLSVYIGIHSTSGTEAKKKPFFFPVGSNQRRCIAFLPIHNDLDMRVFADPAGIWIVDRPLPGRRVAACQKRRKA